MEWIFLSALVVYLLMLGRFFPELFAPHCPICQAQVEHRFDLAIVHFSKQWKLGWRKFTCPQCLYSYRRPVVYRELKESRYETRAVRRREERDPEPNR